MITAYLAGLPSLYEGEDIEIRFCIYEEDVLLGKETILMEYQKPATVYLHALSAVLKALKQHSRKEIEILVNDSALNELMRETSTTKNIDVLKAARKTRREYIKFDKLLIKDIGRDHAALVKWNEMLQI